MGGKSKLRTKGVDVTKKFLQATSVADHIAVQVGPSQTLQVTEEELSPTQGTEAAFALRRDGKLDATMKLCYNWRQGNCHNFAACTFAHIHAWFNTAGEGSVSSSGHPNTSRSGSLGGGGTGTPSAAVAATVTAAAAAAAANHSGSSGNAPSVPQQQQHSQGKSWLERVVATPGSSNNSSATSSKRPAVAGGGSLPAKAQWGLPQRSLSESAASSSGFVDLQTAMAAVERQHSTRGVGKKAAAPTTATTSVRANDNGEAAQPPSVASLAQQQGVPDHAQDFPESKEGQPHHEQEKLDGELQEADSQTLFLQLTAEPVDSSEGGVNAFRFPLDPQPDTRRIAQSRNDGPTEAPLLWPLYRAAMASAAGNRGSGAETEEGSAVATPFAAGGAGALGVSDGGFLGDGSTAEVTGPPWSVDLNNALPVIHQQQQQPRRQPPSLGAEAETANDGTLDDEQLVQFLLRCLPTTQAADDEPPHPPPTAGIGNRCALANGYGNGYGYGNINSGSLLPELAGSHDGSSGNNIVHHKTNGAAGVGGIPHFATVVPDSCDDGRGQHLQSYPPPPPPLAAMPPSPHSMFSTGTVANSSVYSHSSGNSPLVGCAPTTISKPPIPVFSSAPTQLQQQQQSPQPPFGHFYAPQLPYQPPSLSLPLPPPQSMPPQPQTTDSCSIQQLMSLLIGEE